MENYKIFTEVTADLTAEMVNELNIEVIPMEISFSGDENYLHYPDAREISLEDFYSRLKAWEDITTAQVKYAVISMFLSQFYKKVKIFFMSALAQVFLARIIQLFWLEKIY